MGLVTQNGFEVFAEVLDASLDSRSCPWGSSGKPEASRCTVSPDIPISSFAV
jgi:hypothetical protein